MTPLTTITPTTPIPALRFRLGRVAIIDDEILDCITAEALGQTETVEMRSERIADMSRYEGEFEVIFRTDNFEIEAIGAVYETCISEQATHDTPPCLNCISRYVAIESVWVYDEFGDHVLTEIDLAAYNLKQRKAGVRGAKEVRLPYSFGRQPLAANY